MLQQALEELLLAEEAFDLVRGLGWVILSTGRCGPFSPQPPERQGPKAAAQKSLLRAKLTRTCLVGHQPAFPPGG
jgi:hypothetical protein